MEQSLTILDGWKKMTLGEVAELSKSQWKVGGEEKKYLGLEHINQGELTINGFGSSSKLGSSKFYFKVGDVLFGKLRPYFRKVWKAKFDGICSTDIWVLKSKENNDQAFLFYFVANPVFIDKSMGASIGTHMPRADWGFLKNTEWNIPSLLEQQAIAGVLSSLDDKIELLRDQNKTLEDIALVIFKEWFVRFDFPAKTGKMTCSELGEIPEGWRVGKLGDVVDIKGGTTPSTKNLDYWNGDIHWSSPKDLSNSKEIFLLNTEKKITEDGLKKISSGLLPKRTLLLSSRAPIGYLAISNIEIAINQGYIAFLPDQYFSNNFMYLWLKINMETVISSANGSTFLEISKSSFRNIACVVPSKNILEDFDKIVNPVFDKILSNVLQIKTLSDLRDTLLPKLMKGEIRVRGF